MKNLLQQITQATKDLSDSVEANQWERVLEIAQEYDGLLHTLSVRLVDKRDLSVSDKKTLESIRGEHKKNMAALIQHKDRVAQQLKELANGKRAMVHLKNVSSTKHQFVDFLH